MVTENSVYLYTLTKTAEKYVLNPQTLRLEKKKNKHRLLKTLFVIAAGAVLFALYMWIHASVLGKDLPKTAVLRRQNADWQSRVEQMEARLDRDEEALSLLEVRDDRIYSYIYQGRNSTSYLRTRLTATYKGRFYRPAIICEAMYDNTVGASVPGGWVVVK